MEEEIALRHFSPYTFEGFICFTNASYKEWALLAFPKAPFQGLLASQTPTHGAL